VPDYGLTTEGLVIKSLAIIDAEIDASLRATFGDQINTLPPTVFGQLKGIVSERESLIWELVEDVYNAQYPDSAEDASLDNVSAITGITRLSAVASTVDMALFGTATTVIPAGTVFSIPGVTDTSFSTDEPATLDTGVDEIQTITFSGTPTSGAFKLIYDGESTNELWFFVTSAYVTTELNGLSGLSEVIVTGTFAAGFVITFAGADGKREQATLTYSDNTLDDGAAVTIVVTETTPGEYQATVGCTALETGALQAISQTITSVDTPVTGLDSVFNPLDATVGRDIESNIELRIRRGLSTQISEAGPTDAIRNKILSLNDDETKTVLESVIVLENYTTVTDAKGLPPKSFEAVVYEFGGANDRDQEVAEAIYAAKPAGIEAHGDKDFTVTDSQGFDHTVKFTEPDEVDIYLILDLTVDSTYPDGGDDTLEADVVEWGNEIGVGNDVIVYPSLVGQLNGVTGITDVVVKIGITASPTLDNNIDIDDGTGGNVELSRWDTTRITINHV